MPTIKTAKQIAEDILSTIGAFTAAQAAPDPGEMKKTLNWIEMLLNYQSGIRPMPGFWQVYDVPLEAGIGDYDLSDYVDERGSCHVFSVFLVDSCGNTTPLDFQYASTAQAENLSDTGQPSRACVTKDRDMVLQVFPTPTQTEEDAGLVLRVRLQTYHDGIDPTGIADGDVRLRPAWYLWLVKRGAYEVGSGPVRRLGEAELKSLKEDAKEMENALLARDGKESGPKPPVTEPVYGSVEGCNYSGYN